jgi:hypothetical protein
MIREASFATGFRLVFPSVAYKEVLTSKDAVQLAFYAWLGEREEERFQRACNVKYRLCMWVGGGREPVFKDVMRLENSKLKSSAEKINLRV